MTKKMLIDASHPEETRVAVMQNGKIEDFDFEQLSRKPLRGNIYLARITRVEPSLQAAFVEYGGNRHGFLAFGEIHSDYYQIPVSDREVLRKAEALEAELAQALAAFETGEDVEPDLDEEDDGLRAVDGEVPEDDGGTDDDHDEAADAVSDDTSPEEEDEEEENEPNDGAPEEGGSSDEGEPEAEGDVAKKPDEAEAGDPADYAGEAVAEQPGWHAIEEEEIAALPKDEPAPKAASATIETTPDRAAGNAQPDAGGAEGIMPAAAVAAATAENRTTENEKNASQATDGDEASGDAAAEASGDSADAGGPDEEERAAKPRRRRRRGGRGRRKPTGEDTDQSDDGAKSDDMPAKRADASGAQDDENDGDTGGDTDDNAPDGAQDGAQDGAERRGRRRGGRGGRAKAQEADPRAKEIAELERRYEDAKRERAKLLKNYRIQEVVKRRQIMLVQAVKEERGNKGAALTTYLSLAGRYGVLMPNTARGGGVSRKITNSGDRKRLRSAMSELDIPQGMGLIIRTAGAKRTKAEIKRDYDYLSRLWETIRDETLKSVAPCLIYEEASLIKRAIRDLYDKDIEQVSVQGDEGYREAKDFMKMLMPSHAKNVQPYREKVPLFLKHQVERQIDEMFQPTVKLPSGGYLVIQQTEALVSVDVNSGKSTKERNVEQTALKTNLEAAKEVARQCKLRDLAGLVVIDFIDMDERKNNRAVEKHLKDAMKHDRARIQLGGISDFGLLEFSRQRKRSGIVDGTTRLCPLCEGAGNVRSVEMAAMRILRSVEEEALKGRVGHIRVETAMDVALYTLNTKRDWLARIENTYGASVEVLGDVHKNGDQYEMTTSGEPRPVPSLRQEARAELAEPDEEVADEKSAANDDTAQSEDKPKRRRSRGGRGRNRNADSADSADAGAAEAEDASGTDKPAGKPDDSAPATEESEAENDAVAKDEQADVDAGDDGDDRPKKRRRRGRRGGRRNRKEEGENGEGGEGSADSTAKAENADAKSDEAETAADPVKASAAATKDEAAPDPSQDASSEDVLSEDGSAVAESYTETAPAVAQPAAPDDAAANPEPTPQADPAPEPAVAVQSAQSSPRAADDTPDDPDGPKRGGWWQRALGR